MDNSGVLVVNELLLFCLKVLVVIFKCMGVGNCVLLYFDGVIFGDYMYECFDSILLDVLCLGEGMVCKDVDVLKNWLIEFNIDIVVV